MKQVSQFLNLVLVIFNDKLSGRKWFSLREAVGLSILLHLMATVVVASFWLGNEIFKQPAIEPPLMFELEPSYLSQSVGPTNPVEQSGMSSLTTEKQVGTTGSRGNLSRDAFLMASLASLDELREAFTPALHPVSTDTVGSFSPLMEGTIPGSNGDSFGWHKGTRAGSGRGISISIGSGGGNCPPGPTILQ